MWSTSSSTSPNFRLSTPCVTREFKIGTSRQFRFSRSQFLWKRTYRPFLRRFSSRKNNGRSNYQRQGQWAYRFTLVAGLADLGRMPLAKTTHSSRDSQFSLCAAPLTRSDDRAFLVGGGNSKNDLAKAEEKSAKTTLWLRTFGAPQDDT